MTLTFEQQDKCAVPTSVAKITPDALAGMTLADIERLPIAFGNQTVHLADRFKVRGKANSEHIWRGPLENVHEIGAGQSQGVIRIESNAGRHVGKQMSGGEIHAAESVSDFLGIEMTGGTIRVEGNAGDSVGGSRPGSKFGMNRGMILVSGNAGSGVGQHMRRGTIVVGGETGSLTGWHMRAGTILVFGKCGVRAGAEMIRGTIIAATPNANLAGPTFVAGSVSRPPVLNLIANWVSSTGFNFDRESLTDQNFATYAGDVLHGGRGELFVAQ